MQDLLYRVQEMLDALPPPVQEEPAKLPEITPPPDENAFRIYKTGEGAWRVEGVAIERAAEMTNWDYYEAALRFQRILRAMGVTDALREKGVKDGDTVTIGTAELIWGYDNAFGE